jgi:hypothetical protein
MVCNCKTMSAGNDDFIRRRICDLSLTKSGDEENFLHRRSLAQMWAAVTAEVNEACADPKSDTNAAGEKNSKENNEQ